MKLKFPEHYIGLAVLAIALIYVARTCFFGGSRAAVSAQTLEEGQAYIAQMEARDVAEVKSQISSYRKAERRKLLEEGKLSVWDMFEDYVVLGDSRAVGFYYHGFLEEERTLAFGGATIRDVPDYLDTIKSLNPSYIFLCYGLNDVSIGYWNTPQEYTEEFVQVMDKLAQAAPKAQIYISSILIARDPAFETSEKWRQIPEFNEALKAMAEEHHYNYVDNTDLCEQYADLWDEDGIHVKKEFYPYWGANLIAEVDDES